MEKGNTIEDAGGSQPLPPPPPPPAVVPPNVKPEKPPTPKYSVMSRRGVGRSGRRISLLANHFKVAVNVPDAVFYQYSVCSINELMFLHKKN